MSPEEMRTQLKSVQRMKTSPASRALLLRRTALVVIGVYASEFSFEREPEMWRQPCGRVMELPL